MDAATLYAIGSGVVLVVGLLLIVCALVLGRVVYVASNRAEKARVAPAKLVELEGKINALGSEHDRFQKREDQRWRREVKATETSAAPAPGTPGGTHLGNSDVPGGDYSDLFVR